MFCGLDTGYEAFPYLYLLDVQVKATDLLGTAVCVSACPQNDSAVPVLCKTTKEEKDCNPKDVLRYNTVLGILISW